MALTISSGQYPYHYLKDGSWMSLWTELGVVTPLMINGEIDSRGMVIPMFPTSVKPIDTKLHQAFDDYRNYWINDIGYSSDLVEEVINSIVHAQPVYSIHNVPRNEYGISVGTYLPYESHDSWLDLVAFDEAYKSFVLNNFPDGPPAVEDTESWEEAVQLEMKFIDDNLSRFNPVRVAKIAFNAGGSGTNGGCFPPVSENITIFTGMSGIWRMNRVNPYIECMDAVQTWNFPTEQPPVVPDSDGLYTINTHAAVIDTEYMYPDSFPPENIKFIRYRYPRNYLSELQDELAKGVDMLETMSLESYFLNHGMSVADQKALYDALGLVGGTNTAFADFPHRYSSTGLESYVKSRSGALGDAFNYTSASRPVGKEDDVIGYAIVPTRFSNMQVIADSFESVDGQNSIHTIPYVNAKGLQSMSFMTTTHEIANTFEILYGGDPQATKKIQELRLEAERPIAWRRLKNFAIPDRIIPNLRINALASKAGEVLGNKKFTDNLTFKQADNKYQSSLKKREVISLGETIGSVITDEIFGMEAVGGAPFTVDVNESKYVIYDYSMNELTEDQARWVLAKSTDWSLSTALNGDVDSVYDYFFNQNDSTAKDVLAAINGVDSSNVHSYTAFSPEVFIKRGYPTVSGLDKDGIARFLLVAKGIDKSTFEDAMASTLMLACAPFKYTSLVN